MARILTEGFMRERCSHRWDPRGEAQTEPGICPEYKTPKRGSRRGAGQSGTPGVPKLAPGGW